MNPVNTVTKNDVISWVTKALEKENFTKYEISFDGTSDKCDGFIGVIVFVTVTGATAEKKEKVLNLVVKHSKQNNNFRASAFKLMFDAEIHFYDTVYPVMEKFQLHKNVSRFSAIPKCFKTLFLDEKEVLVFENLKTQGFEMHSRKKPLNVFHMKAVLEQFGKFHALSFALRDQRKAEFEAILENYPNFMGTFLSHRRTKGCFGIALKNALKVLLDHGELELVDKFNKMLLGTGYSDPSDLMAKFVGETDSQSVIVHGDGWSNNFMFKYKGHNRTTPCEVAILDWQVSCLCSPAIDLTYFVYSTASVHELKHFDELMRTYYASFAKFLRALGSDPEELFPFSALQEHWRRYSMYGLIFSGYLLTFILCDAETAPAFEDLQDEQNLEDMLIIDASKNELYFERFRDVVRHYFDSTF